VGSVKEKLSCEGKMWLWHISFTEINFNKLMVVNGYPSTGKDAEVIDINGGPGASCQQPAPFPDSLSGAGGAFLGDNLVLSCGGHGGATGAVTK